MVKIVHLALACPRPSAADDDDTDIIKAARAEAASRGGHGDLFASRRACAGTRRRASSPINPSGAWRGGAGQNPKYWVTGSAGPSGARRSTPSAVGNIQPVKVGTGQIYHPASAAAVRPGGLARPLDPRWAPSATYDVCKSRCPHAIDECPRSRRDSPACTTSTHHRPGLHHLGDGPCFAHRDGVQRLRLHRVPALEHGRDDGRRRHRLLPRGGPQQQGRARPGHDEGIAHEGNTFAMYNKFKAVWTSVKAPTPSTRRCRRGRDRISSMWRFTKVHAIT